jgi:hypothetical protein
MKVNRLERDRVCFEGQQTGSRRLSKSFRVSVRGGERILKSVSNQSNL